MTSLATTVTSSRTSRTQSAMYLSVPTLAAAVSNVGSSATSGCNGSQFRVVVLGSGHVGKTSLVRRLVDGQFLFHYVPTVEDSYRHLVQLPDGRYKSVEILDTAGSHQFPAMRELNIKRGQAFFVVYSVDDYQSFIEATSLIDQIAQVKSNRFNTTPVVLVGNKLDLAGNNRAVSTDEASHAASTRHCAFAETSAKTSDIGQAIDSVLGQLLVIGFDVPLQAASTTSSPPPADVDELGFKPGTGSVRVRRGQGQGSRRKLGRSRSAGLMVTNGGASSSNQSPTNRGSPVINGGKVRLQQRHSTVNQLTTGGSQVTDEELLNDQLQDSRCVIL